MGRRVDRGPGPERGPADATLPFLHTELEASGGFLSGLPRRGKFRPCHESLLPFLRILGGWSTNTFGAPTLF